MKSVGLSVSQSLGAATVITQHARNNSPTRSSSSLLQPSSPSNSFPRCYVPASYVTIPSSPADPPGHPKIHHHPPHCILILLVRKSDSRDHRLSLLNTPREQVKNYPILKISKVNLSTHNGVPSAAFTFNIYIPTTPKTELSNSTTFPNSSRPSPCPRFASLHSDRIHLLMYLVNNSLYTVVFVRSPETWLIPLTKLLIQQCIAIAHDTFIQLKRRRAYDSTFPFETPAKLLQRLLNSITSDRTGTKTSIAYFIGNQLFRCYFKVGSHVPLRPSLLSLFLCVCVPLALPPLLRFPLPTHELTSLR